MPCQDYSDMVSRRFVEDVENDYKKIRDKLARIACKAMTQLEKIDPKNELFKDKEAGPWFRQHKIDDAAAAKRRANAVLISKRRAKVKKAQEAKSAALNKLTAKERKLLGLK